MSINIFITLTFFLSCFSHSASVSASATTAATNYELAAQVCSRTPDSKFCINAFISDPNYQPSANADAVSLAYIIFGKAYLFGNETKTNIESNITKIGGRRADILNSLKTCQSGYRNAVGALSLVLENLESETYCHFDTLSAAAQGNGTTCGKGLRRNQITTLARDNDYFVNLAGICYAVAKLFSYHC